MEFLNTTLSLWTGGADNTFSALGELPEGSFRGYASVFGGTIDAYCPTIIHSGAFTKTLQEKGRGVKILWQHDVEQPIGVPTFMSETDLGLAIQAKISQTSRGQEALTLIRDGVLDAMSIGFDSIKEEFVKDARGDVTRHIKEIRLHEVSVVTWGADFNARIQDVHTAGGAKLQDARTSGGTKLLAQIKSSGVLPYNNLPIGQFGIQEGFSSLEEWAGTTDQPNTKYGRAFTFTSNPAEWGAFQFPVAKVVNGELTVIPELVFESALDLTRSDIPDEECERLKFHFERYFAKMRKQFNDETIVAPWDTQAPVSLSHYREAEALYLLGTLLTQGKLNLADAQSALSLVNTAVPTTPSHTEASEDVDQLLQDAELLMAEMQVESL